MIPARPVDLVLAMYPFSRGLAFTLFESPLSPVDWAVKDIRGHSRRSHILDVTKSLIDRYRPDVLILPGQRTKLGRRSEKTRRLDRVIEACAVTEAVECHHYSREAIRACFQKTGAITRYQIAQTIAAHVPALSHHLPSLKKLWQSEDRRMGLFDAASLALTHFCNVRPWTNEDIEI